MELEQPWERVPRSSWKTRLLRRLTALPLIGLLTAVSSVGLSAHPAWADPDGFTQLALTLVDGNVGGYLETTFLRGTLQDANSAPIANEPVKFTIGSATCSAITDSGGAAECGIHLTVHPGTYSAQASFAGDPSVGWDPSTAAQLFTVTKGFAFIKVLSGPMSLRSGARATWKIQLNQGQFDQGPPLPGFKVVVTIKSFDLPGTQTCTILTNTQGIGSCSITVTQKPNPDEHIAIHFGGNALYQPGIPGETDADLLGAVYALTPGGLFTIGDQESDNQTLVTFAGASWSAANPMSGGAAPASFDGFATTLPAGAPTTCGGQFSAVAGAKLPSLTGLPWVIPVLVTGKVTAAGGRDSGTVQHVVLVSTRGADSTGPGTGTVLPNSDFLDPAPFVLC